MSDRDDAPPDHDVYDVVVPTVRDRLVDVHADRITTAKVLAKEDVELEPDEILRGAGNAVGEHPDYTVVVKVGRELPVTVVAAHPQEARRKAKLEVQLKPGETVAGKPRVSRAPGDRHVDRE